MRTFTIEKVKPRLLSASCSAADKMFQRFAVRTALTHLPSSMSSQKLPLQQRGCAVVAVQGENRCKLCSTGAHKGRMQAGQLQQHAAGSQAHPQTSFLG